MPWTVRLQDADGKPVVPQDLVLPFDLLGDLAPQWIMLKGIDPYSDTTFNTLQTRFFLAEWDALAARLHTPEDRAIWEKIREYAQKCVEEVHLYLKFIGD